MRVVRHYENGNLYLVVDEQGMDVDDKHPKVIYKSQTDNKYYSRNPDAFNGKIKIDDKEYPRFQTVGRLPRENLLKLSLAPDYLYWTAIRNLTNDYVMVVDLQTGREVPGMSGDYNEVKEKCKICGFFEHREKDHLPPFAVKKEAW